MSLTSHLQHVDGPIARFIAETFPVILDLKGRSVDARALQSELDISRILGPALLPLKGPPSNGTLVGTAIDYRVRYFFESYRSQSTVASGGAGELSVFLYSDELSLYSDFDDAGQLAFTFLKEHDDWIGAINPLGRILPLDMEMKLCRHCLVLGLLEQIARGEYPESPLRTLTESSSLNDLVALPTEECVADMYQLSIAFEKDNRSMFAHKYVLNPTFSGSQLVGGADADIALNDVLYELKTYSNFNVWNFHAALLQLLGYVLLDTEDILGIRNVGLILPRQRKTWTSPIMRFVGKHLGNNYDDAQFMSYLQDRRKCFVRKFGAPPKCTIKPPLAKRTIKREKVERTTKRQALVNDSKLSVKAEQLPGVYTGHVDILESLEKLYDVRRYDRFITTDLTDWERRHRVSCLHRLYNKIYVRFLTSELVLLDNDKRADTVNEIINASVGSEATGELRLRSSTKAAQAIEAICMSEDIATFGLFDTREGIRATCSQWDLANRQDKDFKKLITRISKAT
jgi:hypothetical protein